MQFISVNGINNNNDKEEGFKYGLMGQNIKDIGMLIWQINMAD